MTASRRRAPARPPGGAGPVGAFSAAATFGERVFTSGQIPQDPETGEVRGDRPFAEQARLVLSNLERVLEAAGSGVENVLSVTVFLEDHWAEFNAIYQETFREPFPARAVVGASLEHFRVEATAVAVRRSA